MNTYSISRWVYLAGAVLAVAFILPTVWLPFALTKVALFAAAAAVAAVLFVWSGGMRELVRSWGARWAGLIVLFPVSYLLSWMFSSDRSVGIFGNGFEVDTLAFTVLCAVAFVLAFGMFRTLRGATQLLSAVFWVSLAVVLFQLVAVLIGPGALFGLFTDRSVNLVGKWNDLGLLVALLSVLVLVRLEFSSMSRLAYGTHILLGVSLAILLAIINFSVAWAFILVACIALAVVRFLIERGIPYHALAGALVAVLLLFFGGAVNTQLTAWFPVSSLEVRPSYESTLQVQNEARGSSIGNLLFGTGPNTFSESWLMYRPVEVNQSQFWSLDFNVGYSTFMTAFGSVGLLGFLGWLVAPILLIAGVVRVIRKKVLGHEDTLVAIGLTSASLLLCAALIFYVPSQNLTLLFFALAGATYAFLWRQGQSGIAEEVTHKQRIMALALSVPLVAAIVLVGLGGVKMLVSESIVNQGLIALSQNDAKGAVARADAAAMFGASPSSLRLKTSAGVAQLQELAATTSTAAEVRDLFTSMAQKTIESGQGAVMKNGKDYRNHLALANVYAYLATLKVSGALESARTSFEAAAKLNPKNPSIPLLQAQLEVVAADVDGVQKYLTQALTLKNDYTDAILMAVQLYVANNDLQNAVQAAAAAVRSAPGVPSLWFQLGVLLWTGNATKDAAQALEQAVVLQKDYANAKYFLGLAYWAQGQKEQAIGQFADLMASNPDNAEVKTTLEKMRDGTQPLRPNPPTAETAPVAQ